MLKRNKMMIFLLAAVMTIGLFAGCAKQKPTEDTSAETAPAEAKKIIKVGAGGTYNPWCFKENDVLQGFEIDVWNEIAERAGYEIEFTVGKFSGLFGMLDAGQIDTVAHQVSITEERKEKYDFTEPYAFSKYDFAVKKDSPLQTLEDIKGKKVGAWLGGNGERTIKALNEEYGLDLDIVLYDGTPLEKEVEMGRLDACWQGAIKTNTVIKQGDLDLKLMAVNVEIGSEINAYPFAKTEENKEKIQAINKAIQSMHEDGTLAELSMKWFDLDTTKK
ncbi:transporter substrate-binding domain-containing protein [Clostridiaceae bacterium 35-E11]